MKLVDENNLILRTISYVAKLAIFLVVPGLHLSTIKNIVGMIMLSVGIAIGVIDFIFPFAQNKLNWIIISYSSYLLITLLIASILFTLIDIRQIHLRSASKPSIFLASIFVAIMMLLQSPLYMPRYIVAVEISLQMCPTICAGDVNLFEAIGNDDPKLLELAPGDIVVFKFQGVDKSARILATSGQQVCFPSGKKVTLFAKSDKHCETLVNLNDGEIFVVGDNPQFPDFEPNFFSGVIAVNSINGVRPVIVGNWLQFLTYKGQLYSAIAMLFS